MLKGISKTLTGDILKMLFDMGHGDRIAIVDANYPANRLGMRVVPLPGVSATGFLKSILPLFPLDHIETTPALLMNMTKEDSLTMDNPTIWKEFSDMIHNEYGEQVNLGKLSREDFYNASKDCYLIIQTGEERLYGNLILVKGVVR